MRTKLTGASLIGTLLLVLAFIVPWPSTASARAQEGSRVSVVGGAVAPLEQYRSVGVMVIWYPRRFAEDNGLRYGFDQGFAFCSSTLIAPTVVLTAAHCLRGGKLYQHPNVVFDKARLDGREPGIRSRVKSIAINPHASGNNTYGDVGLAFLSHPVNAIEPMPIGVPGTDPDPEPSDIVGSAGWGISHRTGLLADFGFIGPSLKLTWGNLDSPGVCQKKSTLIRSAQRCLRRDSRWGSLCNGDSGGPLVLLDDSGSKPGYRSRTLPPQRLVGVNSFTVFQREGTKCSRKALNVFQSMAPDSPLNSWVRRTLANHDIDL